MIKWNENSNVEETHRMQAFSVQPKQSQMWEKPARSHLLPRTRWVKLLRLRCTTRYPASRASRSPSSGSVAYPVILFLLPKLFVLCCEQSAAIADDPARASSWRCALASRRTGEHSQEEERGKDLLKWRKAEHPLRQSQHRSLFNLKHFLHQTFLFDQLVTP